MTNHPIRVNADVYLDDLATYLAGQVGIDSLVKFVLALEDRVHDIRFTEAVFDAVGDIVVAHDLEMDCD